MTTITLNKTGLNDLTSEQLDIELKSFYAADTGHDLIQCHVCNAEYLKEHGIRNCYYCGQCLECDT